MSFASNRQFGLHFAAIFLLNAVAFASTPGSFDRTLSVTGPVSLEVRSDPGGVHITTGPSPNVIVHAIIRPLYGRVDFDIAEANIRALEKDPPIERSGNQIRIGFPKDPAMLRAVTIRYEIQTPRVTQVQAQTTSGAILIEGIEGPATTITSSGRTEISNLERELRATSSSGAIVIRGAGGNVYAHNESGALQLDGVKGMADAETSSGRIMISDVGGDVRASTHSASIRVERASGSVEARNGSGSIDALGLGGAVHAETTSGAIRLSQVSPAPMRALTRSGALNVELASGGGYMLDARSHSGKVFGPPASSLAGTKDGHSLQGQINSGGPLVDLDTHSSKIRVD
jgi:hypothetical protein